VDASANPISLSDRTAVVLGRHTVTPGVRIPLCTIRNVYVSKVFSLHLCHKTEGDEKVGRRSSEKDASRIGEKKENGKKGSKNLLLISDICIYTSAGIPL
jgi:hypothetical protein